MITISLCMIVKDEEKTLNRCLTSVSSLVDEIIIVDTGSTDRTKEIARNYTSHVFDFKWTDNFSAARNYSFEHANMEYIFWLDADDVLLEEDRKKLRNLKESLSPSTPSVSMIYHTSFDRQNNVVTSNRRIRLVKRSVHPKWHGVVHEDLTFSDGTPSCYDSDIIVTHTQDHRDAQLSKRNLQIYEKHKGSTMSAHDVFHYARELHAHKQYEQAIEQYERFLNFETIDLESRMLTLHKLASCYHLVGKLEQEWEITLKSLEYDTPRPEFCCRLGEHFIKRSQFRQAAFWYEIATKEQLENPWAIEQQPFKTWLPHKQLGLCYYHLNNYERSLQHNKIALTYLPDDQDLLSNIAFLEHTLAKSSSS